MTILSLHSNPVYINIPTPPATTTLRHSLPRQQKDHPHFSLSRKKQKIRLSHPPYELRLSPLQFIHLNMTVGDLPGEDGRIACTLVGRRCDPLVKSLVRMIVAVKDWEVRVVDPDKGTGDGKWEWEGDNRVRCWDVDILDSLKLSEVIRGSSDVFVLDLGELSAENFYDCYMLVVQGSKVIIDICKECKVERLIYNSSADVVFDGLHEIQDGNETLSYPLKFKDIMNDFKAQAEAIVLCSNGNGLLTCALRPSNTFGPKDIHFVEFLVNKAKDGSFKFIIGSDETLADFTYVENVAHAHMLAQKALCSKISYVAGKPFFITNLKPMKIWEFITLVVEGLGYQRPLFHLPVKFALFIAMVMEWVNGKLFSHGIAESCFTQSMIRSLSCTRTFDCSQAEQILEYSPIVSIEEGIRSTLESFSDLTKVACSTRGRNISIPSKAERILGSRGAAEILLWRDAKKTFSYCVTLFFLFRWFFLSGRTWITSGAKLLQLVMVILFIHGYLPSSVFGFTIWKMSLSNFDVSETTMKGAIKSLANVWNQGFYILRKTAEGNDGRLFLKVAGSMYILSVMLQFPLSTLIGAGLVMMFTVFIVYEQHEAEVDKLMTTSAVYVMKSRDMLVEKLPGFLAKYLREL